MLPIRSYLFVPATHIDRIDKAHDKGADAVIVDLEDAVSFDKKDTARQALLAYDKTATNNYWLRINTMGDEYDKDLALIDKLDRVVGIVLPKATSEDGVHEVFHRTNLPIIAMIESLAGWQALHHIARASGVYALSFGALDLANELGFIAGSDGADIVLNRLRTDLLVESAICGINPPIDCVYANFDDDDGMARQVQRWYEMGFSGQMCIHPRQLGIIKNIAKADEPTIAFAKEVLATFYQTEQFAFAVHGRMVDLPVVERAKRLIDELDEMDKG